VASPPPDNYKWIALSITTVAMLLYSVNQTIVLVALPSIFEGLHADPLAKSGAGYLLWVMSGYTATTTVLLATFGRIADRHGKVRLYVTGFAVFTLGSLLCAWTPSTGDMGALELIVSRIVQGVGGAILSATSLAILTDAFPPNQRGLAFSFNQLAFIGGNVLGVIVGGLLAAVQWRLVFLFSVPLGIGGALWALARLRETGNPSGEPPDWWGNLAFGSGMIVLMLGLTYALVPYAGQSMGWSNPAVLAALGLGASMLVVFVVVESRVQYPMFEPRLLQIRAFLAANIAGFMFSLARGGLQFILIIWLQAVWLPLHGVRFSEVPLQAGIILLPMMLGFLMASPASGLMADRYGAKLLSTAGLVVLALSLVFLATLPGDFNLSLFIIFIFIVGVAMGLFAAPNSTQIMGSVPSAYRGIASGMRQTVTNTGQLVSTAFFLTILIGGLSRQLPSSLERGLTSAGVPAAGAHAAAGVPAGSAVFAALLGYNPVARLLPSGTLAGLPRSVGDRVLGGHFFASLISAPLADSMHVAFLAAAAAALLGAVASGLRGPRVVQHRPGGQPATVIEPAIVLD
jgi:MFS family permease